jgi:lambda family phage portal protein
MNPIDRVIGFFNPRSGAQRLKSRFLMEYMEKQTRAYDAAGRGRRTKNWNASNVSANVELEASLEKLRARSRELDRNNPYAKRAVERIADNVIGTGIRPTPQKENKKLKEAWKNWAEKKECDFDGLMSFYGLQRLAMRTVAESGECIIRMRRTKENKKSGIPIQLQIFEPDIIDSSRNLTIISGPQANGPRNAGGYVIQGVEFDAEGKRIGYWLWDRYPSEHIVTTSLVSKFVPVDEVMHIYLVERPGQVRGIPFGVSSFLRLKDFDEYEDAELVRQKVAACFAAFITESLDTAPGESVKGNVTERLEPGLISRMNTGESVTFSNPPTKEGIDDYSRQILQGIAAGYGMSYEALTGDMRNVNFSSGRMGWLEFQRQISNWQNNMFITMFCQTAWDWFMIGAKIGNIVPSRGGDFEVDWVPPRREMIDPGKEIAALNLAVRSGFQDWGEAVTELGGDPETVLDRIQKFNGEFDNRGIILDSDPRRTAVGGKAQQDPAEAAANEDSAPQKDKKTKKKVK